MFGAGAQTQRTRESVNNALYVIWNASLFRKVVDRVGVERLITPDDPRAQDTEATPPHERWLHEAQAWWNRTGAAGLAQDGAGVSKEAVARWISERISITPITNGTVLSIQHVATSPELAQRVVQAALESAIEVYREAFSRIDATAQVRAELEKVREVASTAQEALMQFEGEHGIQDFAAERAQLHEDIVGRERELDASRVLLASREAEREILESMLSGLPTVEEVGAPVTRIPNPEIRILEGIVIDLERRLMDLDLNNEIGSVRKGEQRQLIEAQLHTKRQDLAQAPQTIEVSGEAASSANPRFATLQTRLDEARVTIKSLQRSNEELGALLQRDRERLTKLESAAPRHGELLAQVEEAQEEVRRLSASEASFEDLQRLDRMELSNLLIVQDATFQPEKVGPQRGKLAVFGLMLGLVAGFGLAVMSFAMKRQVRDPEDAILLGAPYHGRLPRERNEPAYPAPGSSVLSGVQSQVAQVWSRIPLDRTAGRGVSIAFLRDVAGERLSSAAACFAMGLAMHGQEPVVLVCGDPDGSWLLRRLRVQPEAGWSDVAAGKIDLDDALVVAGIGRLTVMSLGHTPDAGMASAGSRKLLEKLTTQGCYVVVELPPLSSDPTARAALGLVDGCEIVLTRGRSARSTAREAIQAVRESGATLAGILLEDNLPRRGAHQRDDEVVSIGGRSALDPQGARLVAERARDEA
jgi:Mrp family chromosome partitioning ATPase/capsular polysaccharide biosynthesis protein